MFMGGTTPPQCALQLICKGLVVAVTEQAEADFLSRATPE